METTENNVEEAVFDLDSMIVKEGEELDRDKTKFMNINKGQLAYDNNPMPLPGSKTIVPTAEDVTLEGKALEDNIAKTSAMMKLKEEKAAFDRMSDNEKIKDYVIKSQYYTQTNNWFHKYGYEMSGKQKRNLKRDLEQAWKKGKFKLTEDQKTDILYELSKASNNITSENKQPTNNVEDHISSLNSAIFRMQ